MTPGALARLHAQCFQATPPPWSAADFASLLAAPGTLLHKNPGGFALARHIPPEAEILTLAVHPDQRRCGCASTLVTALEAAAQTGGCNTVFLEVAQTNHAARQLYANCGYREVGRREGYYRATDGTPVAALVLQKRLS